MFTVAFDSMWQLVFRIDGYFIFCRNQYLHLALSDFLTSNSFARLLTIAFEVLAFIWVKIQANEPCGSKYVSWPSKLFKLWSSFFRSNFCGGLF